MMNESVQVTERQRPPATIDTMSIDIPLETFAHPLPHSSSSAVQPTTKIEGFWDRHCPENMQTKTKVYISLLLILPSLIYFLVSLNMSGPKPFGQVFHTVRPSDESVNITVFRSLDFEHVDEKKSRETFRLAAKHDQLVLPNRISSEDLVDVSDVDSAIEILSAQSSSD